MSAPVPSVPRVWREDLLVRAYEVGPDERASVLALVDYCQEAAGNHARALGVERFDLPSGPGHWVLGRLRMAVDRYPAIREAVTVETWPAAGRCGFRPQSARFGCPSGPARCRRRTNQEPLRGAHTHAASASAVPTSTRRPRQQRAVRGVGA